MLKEHLDCVTVAKVIINKQRLCLTFWMNQFLQVRRYLSPAGGKLWTQDMSHRMDFSRDGRKKEHLSETNPFNFCLCPLYICYYRYLTRWFLSWMNIRKFGLIFFFFTASLIKLQIFRITLYLKYERSVQFAFLSHIFQCLGTIYIALIVDLSCSIV